MTPPFIPIGTFRQYGHTPGRYSVIIMTFSTHLSEIYSTIYKVYISRHFISIKYAVGAEDNIAHVSVGYLQGCDSVKRFCYMHIAIQSPWKHAGHAKYVQADLCL